MTEWHIVSSEYPPQVGGVSDYVARLAAGLAAAGHRAHVWCPSPDEGRPEPHNVILHPVLGSFRPTDLRHADRDLESYPAPRRILVQWVPHGYGYRSLNLPFCLWLRRRARKGDEVDLMVHEAFLSFEGSWKQKGAATVHRLMISILLSAARRVWISTPAWERALEPFAPPDTSFTWLPVPTSFDPIDDAAGVAELRSKYTDPGTDIVGHFGRYSREIAARIKAALPRLIEEMPTVAVLLLGEGSERLREETVREFPSLADRIKATGVLAADDLSRHLQICDVLLQLYPEGITARRTSSMAALAHGVPIVTTDGWATEAIWREGSPVCLVPASDADAVVPRVKELLRDGEMRAAYRLRARQLYQDRFDIRHTIQAITDGTGDPRQIRFIGRTGLESTERHQTCAE